MTSMKEKFQTIMRVDSAGKGEPRANAPQWTWRLSTPSYGRRCTARTSRTSSLTAIRRWVVPQRRPSHTPSAHQASNTPSVSLERCLRHKTRSPIPDLLHARVSYTFCSLYGHPYFVCIWSRCPPHTPPAKSSKGVDWKCCHSACAPKPANALGAHS